MFCLHSPCLRAPLRNRFLHSLTTWSLGSSTLVRGFSNRADMSDLFVELTAPNGRKYTQPRGLFINNEFVPSKSGETITSINPRYQSQGVEFPTANRSAAMRAR